MLLGLRLISQSSAFISDFLNASSNDNVHGTEELVLRAKEQVDDGAAFASRTTDCDAMLPQMWEAGEGIPPLQATSKEPNLCDAQGKLGVELWLLGAAKTGTSSMAHDLGLAGIPSDVFPRKESHRFDALMLSRQPDLKAHAAGFLRALRRESRRSCPVRRTVKADYTPDNFRNWWLPQTLRHMYPKPHLRRLKFIIMVREPLDRLTSGFFFLNSNAPTKSFRKYLREALDKPRGTGNPNVNMDFRVWASMYGEQLQNWLGVAEPDQFYIIPKGFYFGGFKASMFRELGDWLKVRLPEDKRDASHVNRTPGRHHNPRRLLTPALLKRFYSFIRPDVELFTDLLARGSTEGMRLGNFTGPLGNNTAIRDWLKAGW